MSDIDVQAGPGPSNPFSSWKIDHAGIRVPDFDQAIDWYKEKLNFELLRSVSLRGMTFGFVAPAADHSFSFEIMGGPGAAQRPPYEALGDSYDFQGWHHIGIRVDDVDAAIDELRLRDVMIVSEPHDVEPMKLRVAFFGDPWGNLLEASPRCRDVHVPLAANDGMEVPDDPVSPGEIGHWQHHRGQCLICRAADIGGLAGERSTTPNASWMNMPPISSCRAICSNPTSGKFRD
jgi:glyoxylase I family protein